MVHFTTLSCCTLGVSKSHKTTHAQIVSTLTHFNIVSLPLQKSCMHNGFKPIIIFHFEMKKERKVENFKKWWKRRILRYRHLCYSKTRLLMTEMHSWYDHHKILTEMFGLKDSCSSNFVGGNNDRCSFLLRQKHLKCKQLAYVTSSLLL